MTDQSFRRRELGAPASLDPKPMSASHSLMGQVMLPNDANPMGNVHGGAIMKMVDIGAAVSAMRHCGRQVVTVALDHMDFKQPAYIGDLITISSCVEYVGRTSMVVHANVEAENPTSGKKVLTSSCYLTFVALGDDGRPVPVPPLIAKTPEEEARMEHARRIYERSKEERASVAAGR
ncbi:MAG: acyl-CoA thioesterase [Chloroflexia bacterium]